MTTITDFQKNKLPNGKYSIVLFMDRIIFFGEAYKHLIKENGLLLLRHHPILIQNKILGNPQLL